MRTRLFRTMSAIMLAVGLASSAATPAAAITGGYEDRDNKYSNVGIIFFYDDGGRYRCSATLISSTVLLTAAHCTYGTEGKTLVSFEPLIGEASVDNVPRAKDPAAGYTGAEAKGSGWLSGTSYSHPEYSDFTDMDHWNDVGVVVLDQAVRGITPASIAPVGTLDTIPTSQLSSTLFLAVGYGTEVRKEDEGPQNPTPQSFPLVRRYTEMPGQKLTPQILQTNGNENDNRGDGGTCFGDSGGPLFYQGAIVGVTSYGYTSNCRYIDGYQRVDITVAQEWLAQYLTPTKGPRGK